MSSEPPKIRSSETYRRLAGELGYEAIYLEKVVRLGDLLRAFNANALLGTALALKGGTALNLMQEPVRRLSIDLDFNYVRSPDREDMLSDKEPILKTIHEVASDLGYTITELRGDHGGSKYGCRYRNSSGVTDQIQLDLNWITRVPLGSLQTRRLWQPGGLEGPEALLVNTHELIVGKLRALIDRSAARDVYDACFLPSLISEEWPPSHLKALFVFFTGTLPLPLSRYGLDRLDRLTPREYRSQLLPVLAQGQQIPLPDMIATAKAVLDPMLMLSDGESEFVVRLDQGELRPDLLFPDDPQLSARLAMHPALRWKAQNALEHHRQKRQ